MKITVKSRAHRSLRRLENFNFGEQPEVPGESPFDAFHQEDSIGAYYNPAKYGGGVVYFTDQGVYFNDGEWRRISYVEINKVETPTDKDSRLFKVQLKDGSRVEIPLRGGEGRLRDLFVADRFFRHVISDRAS